MAVNIFFDSSVYGSHSFAIKCISSSRNCFTLIEVKALIIGAVDGESGRP